MNEPITINGHECTANGRLHIYATVCPGDPTKDGEIKCFRTDDPDVADDRARRRAGQDRCKGVIRKAVL